MHISISSLLNEDYAVVHWIDTRGDFMAEKAVRVVKDVFEVNDVCVFTNFYFNLILTKINK